MTTRYTQGKRTMICFIFISLDVVKYQLSRFAPRHPTDKNGLIKRILHTIRPLTSQFTYSFLSTCPFLILRILSPDSIITNIYNTSSFPSSAPTGQWLVDICSTPQTFSLKIFVNIDRNVSLLWLGKNRTYEVPNRMLLHSGAQILKT